MQVLELPHSANCLVCGRSNPRGLRLRLHVVPDSGMVITEFAPGPEHVGFEGIVHGGMLATVLDEAMTWAATWKNKRFCYCGELTTRFRYPVHPGETLRIEALVEFAKPKLVQVASKIFDAAGRLAATGSGKYVPTSLDEHLAFMQTFLADPQTAAAASMLRGLPPAKVEVTVNPSIVAASEASTPLSGAEEVEPPAAAHSDES